MSFLGHGQVFRVPGNPEIIQSIRKIIWQRWL